MRAHGMRRSLWLLSALLMAGVIGVGAWYATDERKAVADAPKPDAKGRVPAKWQEIDKTFTSEVQQLRTDILRPPVSEQQLVTHVRKEFKDRVEPHFLFTGPLPPAVKEPEPVGPATEVKPPEGLDAIGSIQTFTGFGENSPRTTFRWNFKDEPGKTYWFTMGDWVQKDPKKDPKQFKLVSTTQPEPGVYKVTYEVYTPPDEETAVETKVLTFRDPDAGGGPPEEGGILRVIRPQAPSPEGANGEGTEGTSEGTTEDGGTSDEGGPTVVTPTPEVSETEGPDGEVRAQDLRPTVEVEGRNRYKVEFDDRSSRYFRQRGAEKIVEQIKTRPRDLPGGQRGVEIMDTGEVPADVFKVRRGDVIVSINGQPTPNREAILRVVRSIPENTSRVNVVIDRNGRKITFNVDPRDNETRRRAGQLANGMNR